MKTSEIRNLSHEELVKKENALREELGNLRFQHKIRPLEDSSRIKKIKKDIARILTVQREQGANN